MALRETGNGIMRTKSVEQSIADTDEPDSIGVVILRRTRPDLPRGFRTPLVPLIPVLSVLACLWLMINLSVETWIRFVVWMVLGIVIYFAYSRSHSVLAQRARQ
jgi:basic amino acid/polyamine antiporter, APA family